MPLTAALSAVVLPLPLHGVERSHRRQARQPGPAVRRADTGYRPAGAARLKLSVLPAKPEAGQRVQLLLLNPPGGATDYRWDLNGRGVYSLDTGSSPRASVLFAAPGTHRVGVRVAGRTSRYVATLILTARPRRMTGVQHPRRRMAVTHVTGPRGRPHHSALHHPSTHAASDPGVTIADFQFSPSSTTVHAGDTITWTNNGPSAHTATARVGSFDTGVLQKGASASHTFTQPGTFAYFCRIHPFMRGTIVVLPATTSTSSTSGSERSRSSSATAPRALAPASSGQTLPMTGLNVIAGLVCGVLLLGLGLSLRRAPNR